MEAKASVSTSQLRQLRFTLICLQWELPRLPEPKKFIFPDEDFMHNLIDLYFERISLLVPIIHRPTFQRCLKDGLHFRDTKFGSLVLVICALGSHFSDDPRALAQGQTSPSSNGWEWFNQVPILQETWTERTSLYDLQRTCLQVLFLLGGTAPQVCWTIVAVALRLAQDVGKSRTSLFSLSQGHLPSSGAHRRRPQPLNWETECWNRVWW
jgi:hypothetical protein